MTNVSVSLNHKNSQNPSIPLLLLQPSICLQLLKSRLYTRETFGFFCISFSVYKPTNTVIRNIDSKLRINCIKMQAEVIITVHELNFSKAYCACFTLQKSLWIVTSGLIRLCTVKSQQKVLTQKIITLNYCHSAEM